MNVSLGFLAGSILGLFAAPSSTNFTLNAYDFGSGGGSSSSTNYGLHGSVGTQAGDKSASSNFALQSGIIAPLNAYVVPAPTLSNPSDYYNRLNVVIGIGDNAVDVVYAIAFSDDNFVSAQYVQNDNSLGSVVGIEDFQSYAAWGGASGVVVTGLKPNTTYKARVSAIQGDFTQSAYGAASSAVATTLPSLTFAVTTSLTASPPFVASFGSLAPGSIVSASADPIVTVSTNAVQGGTVYIRSTYAGLHSVFASDILASISANLASSAGYGAQVVGVSQAVGGPFVAASPYDGIADNVGGLVATPQPIALSANPVTTGSATIRLKAKTGVETSSANDYIDELTLTASMNF